MEERISSLTLISELWFSYPGYLLEKKDLTDSILKMLKKACRDRNRMLRIASISILFRLLESFSEEKNPIAPGILKTLIFSFVENPHDLIVREHYYENFKALFDANPAIPISLLVEPLIKEITTNEDEPFIFRNFDFDFFTYCVQHPKMNLQMGLTLINLFSKIYLEDQMFSKISCVPLWMLVQRYINEAPVVEFLVQFLDICFALLLVLEKDAEERKENHRANLAVNTDPRAKKKQLALPPSNARGGAGRGGKLTKEEMARRVRE